MRRKKCILYIVPSELYKYINIHYFRIHKDHPEIFAIDILQRQVMINILIIDTMGKYGMHLAQWRLGFCLRTYNTVY